MDRHGYNVCSGGHDLMGSRSLAEELGKYADRSAYGLQRGAGELGDLVRFLLDSVPEPVDRAAGVAAEFMPGHNLREGYRDGVEASRLRGQGRYLDSLEKSADAIGKGTDFLFWLMPGGLVPKGAR